MTFSLELFSQYRDELEKHGRRIYQTAIDLKVWSKVAAVKEVQRQMKEEKFKIVVVGEFSRGKSTFINALLGHKMLPASAKPTTTLLNIVSYSPEEYITLHKKDGSTQLIEDREFQKLVAPKEPIPGNLESEEEYEQAITNIKQIKYVEIGNPLQFCQTGVEIIDTPGTNDLDPGRAEITNTIIPRADAAILLLSARKILSKSEMSFLRDRILASDIQKVFVVINFKDDASEEEMTKVYNFAAEHLRTSLKEPKIFPISAKQALNARRKLNGEVLLNKRGKEIKTVPIEESGILELEAALADFLQYERGTVKLLKTIQKYDKQVHSIRQSLSAQQDALQADKDTFRQQKKDMLRKKEELLTEGNAFIQTLTKELAKKLYLEEKWYEVELKELKKEALKTYQQNLHLSIQNIKSLVEETIAPLEKTLHEKKEQRRKIILQELVEEQHIELPLDWEEEVEEASTTKDYLATIEVGGFFQFVSSVFHFILGDDLYQHRKFKSELSNQLDRVRKQRKQNFEVSNKHLQHQLTSYLSESLSCQAEEIDEQLTNISFRVSLEEEQIQEQLKKLGIVEQTLQEASSELYRLKQAIEMEKERKYEPGETNLIR
jgi:small GTP-binding protein